MKNISLAYCPEKLLIVSPDCSLASSPRRRPSLPVTLLFVLLVFCAACEFIDQNGQLGRAVKKTLLDN